MRNAVLLFLLFLSLSAFAQKDSVIYIPPYDTVYYGGFDNERNCTREKRRANIDAHYNKLCYIDLDLRAPRYKKYMQQVCSPYNLTYYFLPEDKIGLQGFNTIRCYVAAMDSLLKAKYGENIKLTIQHKADSCFFAGLAFDTLPEPRCTKPASIAEANIVSNYYGEVFHIVCDSSLYNTFKKLSSPVAEPIMLASVLIEANGKPSEYRLNYFESNNYTIYYVDTLKNSKVYTGCGNAFWQLGLATLTQHTSWKPATIDTVPVRTWHNVELMFEEKGK